MSLEGHPSPPEWYARMPDGRVRCELCPRYCTMKEGQRGFCFVRGVEDGQVVLTSYGRASGFCIDPIEKKPLNHFHPGTSVLSFGTAGCNLGCRFCQNHDISKARAMDRLMDVASPEAIADAAERAACRSVAFTYNDPVIFAEYAIDTAHACHARGVKTVAVTAGYITEKAREAFFSVIDAANVDLKAFTEGFYEKLTFSELGPVLDTLKYLRHETDVWLEITTLVIPGHNDSPEEIERLASWVAEELGTDVPLHFSAFHPDFQMRDVERTPPSTLARARQQALDAGLSHVYTGNVHDRAGQSTYCAGCGALLIGRDWYQLDAWHLDAEGRCTACGHALAGRFDARPGTWGPKRQRLVIA
ncbi:MAG: AmmeMemoRadiSam system radical SAM enzyme [Sandaracinaceae bacterium]